MGYGRGSGILGDINRTMYDIRRVSDNVFGTHRSVIRTGTSVENTGRQWRTQNNRYESTEVYSESQVYGAGTQNIYAKQRYENARNAYENNHNGYSAATQPYVNGNYRGTNVSQNATSSGTNVSQNSDDIAPPELKGSDARKYGRLKTAEANLNTLLNDNIPDEQQKGKIEGLKNKIERLDGKLGDKDERMDAYNQQVSVATNPNVTTDPKGNSGHVNGDPVETTLDYLNAMRQAQMAAPNSPERAAALKEAKNMAELLTNPTTQKVEFAPINAILGNDGQFHLTAPKTRGSLTFTGEYQSATNVNAALNNTTQFFASYLGKQAIAPDEITAALGGVPMPAEPALGTSTAVNAASNNTTPSSFPAAASNVAITGEPAVAGQIPTIAANQVDPLQTLLENGNTPEAKALKAHLEAHPKQRGHFGKLTLAALKAETGMTDVTDINFTANNDARQDILHKIAPNKFAAPTAAQEEEIEVVPIEKPTVAPVRIIGDSKERHNFLSQVASAMKFGSNLTDDQIITKLEQRGTALGYQITQDNKIDSKELMSVATKVLDTNVGDALPAYKQSVQTLLDKEQIKRIDGVYVDSKPVNSNDVNVQAGGQKPASQNKGQTH